MLYNKFMILTYKMQEIQYT